MSLNLEHLTPSQIQRLIARIPELPTAEKVQLLEELEAFDVKNARRRAREDFIVFCHRVYPGFKEGAHHRHMRPLLHDMAQTSDSWGEEGPPPWALRMTVSMAPRFGKSEFIAYLYVAWYFGHNPKHQVMMVTHTEELSSSFGKKVRDLIDSAEYQAIFESSVQVSRDKSAAGNWTTTQGGVYLALGVGGSAAGKGADLLVADDLCVCPDTLLDTPAGKVRAAEIRPGQAVRGFEGWVTVTQAVTTVHARAVVIDGTTLSDKHPVWTFGRGWQYAKDVRQGDVLQMMSLFDKVVSSTRSVYERLSQKVRAVQARVQHLGHDEAALQQPQGGELRGLRCEGGSRGPALGSLRAVHCGPGACTDTFAHAGPHRQQPRVQPGELSVGGRRDAAEQPHKRAALPVQGAAAVRPTACENRGRAGLGDGAPFEGHGAHAGTGAGVPERLLGAAPRHLQEFGWLRRAVFRLIGTRSQDAHRRGWFCGHYEKAPLGRHKAWASALGLLVGVRSVEHVSYGPGQTFICLSVTGSNTFYANGVLTHNCSEQAVLYGNPETAFSQAWDYMQVGPLQRLMPGGKIVMIGCLTAETGVLMADGTEKAIKYIRPGDDIATYDNGRITTSKITNWIEHRPDNVYKIKTTSGKIVRANERHPFLVDRSGSREWVRVRNLKVGDCMVQVVQQTAAPAHTKQEGCAAPATNANYIPKGESAYSVVTGIGVSGAESSALPRAVKSLSSVTGFATLAMESGFGVPANTGSPKRRSAKAISSIATAFLRRITTLCSSAKAVVAQFVSSRPARKTHGREDPPSCTLTTATTQTESGASCVTTATWPSGTPTQKSVCVLPLSTYVTTPDAVVEIVADGCELVYDIEVARTENFIANGVVSHNTRWGKRDPIARAIQWSKDKADEGALSWHEVRFPAVMEVERDGEQTMVSLWPEQWPLKELMAKKANMRPQFWSAQYLQEPTNEAAALLKREYWNLWARPKPPEIDYVIQTWDTAHETKTRNDYSACTTWGVWHNEERERSEIILLDYWKGRVEYPELKRKALELYNEWKPEDLIIEKKAAGAPLIQELRRMQMFVMEVNPSRGRAGMSNDKYARTNAVTAVFEDGLVWVPDNKWGRELIEVCADFPNGEFDDPVDCTVMAMERFRRGGFIRLSTDEEEDDNAAPPPAEYY